MSIFIVFCSEYLKQKFVFIKGNKYFAQLLTGNPLYKEKLERLFGTGVKRSLFLTQTTFSDIIFISMSHTGT